MELAPLNDQVYQVLRERITNGELRAGCRLDLERASKGLGVSVTPVKDALMRLSAEGLVEIFPRRGTFVKALDPREIDEAYDVRLMIELYTVDGALRVANADDSKRMRQVAQQLATLTDGDKYLDYRGYMALDKELHSYLVRLAGNRQLVDMYESIHLTSGLIRVYALGGRMLEGVQSSTEEHMAIIMAVEQRSGGSVRHAIQQHITNRLAVMREFMAQHHVT